MSQMDKADILQLLDTWQTHMREAETALDKMFALFGSEPEAPFPNAVTALMGELTRQVAARIGCSDEWLEAWWIEHQFGDQPMEAGVVGQPMRSITTISELLDLIMDDAEAASG